MKKEEKTKLEQLFKEIKQGNKRSIEELYNRYNKIVYGIAFSILKNKENSEDVVQTVFSKIYVLEKNKLPTEKIGTWLYTVTKNETLLFLRKNNNDVNLDTIYDLEDENNEMDKLIEKDSYNRLIKRLNQKEQEIVSLKILSNLTFEEIGELLGESTNTIKWRYYKSIYTLKIALGNLGMFIITFVLGIATLRNQKKEAPIIKEDQDFNDYLIKEDIANKENDRVNENQVIQDNENTDSFENVVIEDTNINTTNYLSMGIFSVSSIFLILTITFSIFFAKHQLKAIKKASK